MPLYTPVFEAMEAGDRARAEVRTRLLPPCRRSDSPADLVPLTRRKTHQELEEYIGKSRGVCAAINTELGVVPPASDTAVYSITAQKALASHVGEGNLGPCRLPLTSAHHLPPPPCPLPPACRLPPAACPDRNPWAKLRTHAPHDA